MPSILLRNISARELIEAQLYDSIEPFGEVRHDLQAGIVASVIVDALNALGGKQGKTVSPSDFVLRFEDKKEVSDDQMREHFRLLALMRGGTVVDG